MKIAALILAAGQSRRMGPQNKLLMRWNDKPLVAHVCEAATGSACQQTVLVTGHEREQVEEAARPYGVRCIHNADYEEGMGTSLACGVRTLMDHTDAIIVLLADMPLVQADHINRMIEAAKVEPALGSKTLVVACDGDKPGNPVLFGSDWFGTLAQASGDAGARGLLRSNVDRLFVDIGPAASQDFDVPEAFSR